MSPNARMAIGLCSAFVGAALSLAEWTIYPVIVGLAVMIACAALDVDHDKKGK